MSVQSREKNMRLDQRLADPLIRWFHETARDLPWRRNRSPWHVWVSEIMLQQTRVNTVIPYYEQFMERFPTCTDLAEAPLDTVLKLWEGLGYYSRAKNLWRGANYVLSHCDAQVPSTYEEIIKIPGIGDYTAGAILSLAFNLPYPAVDGNVVRVVARLTNSPWTQGNTKDRTIARNYVQQLLDEYPTKAASINEAFIELGAMICRPQTPNCDICPVHPFCLAADTGTAATLPLSKKSKKRPVDYMTILVIKDLFSGLYPVRRRSPDGLLGGLWEFPYLDGHRSREEVALLLESDGYELLDILPLTPRRHIFSHLEWDMIGWSAVVKPITLIPDTTPLVLTDAVDDGISWVDDQELFQKAMATAIAPFRDEAVPS
ncbi:MAG TPA: A/G-specific adenine glycosylase [Clostridiaceae bacterium]|nr:A/G-specific adenine glycosylase [Clostridiaceae bacterium]